MKLKVKDFFNIPNILCYIRILLIPFFVIVYLNAQDAKGYYFAAIIILASGLTDLMDGYIARKYNQITELGKALDPIADKMTQAAIVFCLMFKVKWMFLLVIIFVLKELFMGVCCLYLLKKNTKLDGAMWFGKLSTAVFYATMFVIIAFPTVHPMFVNILMVITGIFLAISCVNYYFVFRKMILDVRKKH
ncbi:MAG: CDP-alcohol phosphatidyltransferase family protein [Oscillospiraceae bacterium]